MSAFHEPVAAPMFFTPLRLRALRHGLWFGAGMAILIVASNLAWSRLGVDAHAYWQAWHRADLYAVAARHVDAYEYSPAFAQLIRPLTLLPWPAFCALWLGAVAATYVWLLAPVALKWRLPLLIMCSIDIVAGNVWAFFALVLVFGFRYPGIWAFPMLTKITPVIGPVWFLSRREWRSLTVCLGATIGIVLVSYLWAPGLWSDWLHYLRHAHDEAGGDGTALRARLHPPPAAFVAVALPLALATTAYAARTDRRWLLPVAMAFATPFFSANAFLLLAAIPRIREQQNEYRHGDSNPGFRRERAAS